MIQAGCGCRAAASATRSRPEPSGSRMSTRTTWAVDASIAARPSATVAARPTTGGRIPPRGLPAHHRGRRGDRRPGARRSSSSRPVDRDDRAVPRSLPDREVRPDCCSPLAHRAQAHVSRPGRFARVGTGPTVRQRSPFRRRSLEVDQSAPDPAGDLDPRAGAVLLGVVIASWTIRNSATSTSLGSRRSSVRPVRSSSASETGITPGDRLAAPTMKLIPGPNPRSSRIGG